MVEHGVEQIVLAVVRQRLKQVAVAHITCSESVAMGCNVGEQRGKHLVFVVAADADRQAVFTAGEACFLKLAYSNELTVSDTAPADSAKMVSVVTGDVQMYLPMNELVDFEKEKARLSKEMKKAEKDLTFIEKKLNNPGFLKKAPEQVVEGERVKAAKLKEQIAKLQESLSALD